LIARKQDCLNDPGWSKLSPNERRFGTIFETALDTTDPKENLASEEGKEQRQATSPPREIGPTDMSPGKSVLIRVNQWLT
jgi:hypothetical protein